MRTNLNLRALKLPLALCGAISSFVACSVTPSSSTDSSSQTDQNISACSYQITKSSYEGAPEYWGTIKVKNTSTRALTRPSVTFSIPSGSTCDHDEPGWSHTQSGAACTYSRTSNVSIGSGASFTLNFSTDSESSFTVSGIQLDDPSCGGGGAGGGSSTSSTTSATTSGAGGSSTTSSTSTSSTTSGSGGSGGTTEVWQTASLTEFESYPDPGSEECIEFNGCTWAGQFAALDGKQPESWVRDNNIAAVHSNAFNAYKLKTLRLRKSGHEIDVKVYDMCADSDCSGCCTENARPSGNLIDLEKYTAQRFGVPADGQVEWRCLDCE